tara:strand:+ start:329 stop:517 length:189 start_codon:yes stop_codon:yes gene_type:complete
MDATLTFQDRETAKTFASLWAFATLTGHTISATGADGVTTVEVYDVTDAKKAIIDKFIEVTK